MWAEARNKVLTPAQYRSPFGRRPYDLRHAAVSLWLNSEVPATESPAAPARRRRHTRDLRPLHRWAGRRRRNKHITDALSTQDAVQDSGDKGDGGIEHAP